jgi:hypothetical protein
MTIRNALTRGFAAFGALVAILLVAGFVRDVQSFDRTSGGYEPPYTGYTGEPIDWAHSTSRTTGMAHRGHVVNVLVDCTSGMMSFELFKLRSRSASSHPARSPSTSRARPVRSEDSSLPSEFLLSDEAGVCGQAGIEMRCYGAFAGCLMARARRQASSNLERETRRGTKTWPMHEG